MMRTRRPISISLTALWALSAYSLPLPAQDGPLTVGSRVVPLSAGVSDAFRESQASMSMPDPATVDYVPASEEEWLTHIKEKDAGAARVAQALASALSVTIKEDKIAGVDVHWVNPPNIGTAHKGHLFVYIHGGAYVYNGGMAGLVEPSLIAHHLQMKVVSIDYRMPPKHPAPAATDDVISVWKELLKTRSRTSMVMGGTSAGGNITLASTQRFVSLGLPVPAALYIGTPTVDLNAEAGDSRHLNEGADRVLFKMGDFATSYLITGTRDLLLSDTVRAHRELRRAGIEADLHVYEGQGHADYIVAMKTPESAEHYAELNRFVLAHLTTKSKPAATIPGDGVPNEIPRSVGQ